MFGSKISVVIPSRNVRDDLEKCLTSVFNSYDKEDVEVIVSDSNSTDGTIEMIAEKFPSTKLCRSRDVGSYASSINRGIKGATGDFILFLDSDVVVDDKTIPGLLELLKKRPKVGATVCRLLYPDGSV